MERESEFENGHFQLSILLRNPVLIMTNNRAMVNKSANYLKTPCMKNEKLFED